MMIIRVLVALICIVNSLFFLRYLQHGGYLKKGLTRALRTKKGFSYLFASAVFLYVWVCFQVVMLIIEGVIEIVNSQNYSTFELVLFIVLIAFEIAFLVWYLLQKKQQKLVMTNRAVRVFLLSICILTACALYLPVVVCVAVTPFASFISVILLSPCEVLVTKSYIKRAKKKLEHVNPKIIAVTGSYGKTSVKNIIYELIKDDYKTVVSPKSYNTMNGLLITINDLIELDTEVVIVEMGARKMGDIKDLVNLLAPDIAVITGVGNQHLETLKTIQNVLNTKLEIVSHLKDDGVVVYNGEDYLLEELKNRLPFKNLLPVGQDCDVCINNQCELVFDDQTSIYKKKYSLKIFDETCEIYSQLLGDYNRINIALATAVANKMGVNSVNIIDRLNNMKAINNRLAVSVTSGGVIIIDDSYNANSLGVKYAVDLLNEMGNKKYAITCGIIELGEEQYNENYKLGQMLSNVCEAVYVYGENMQAIKDGVMTQYINMQDNQSMFFEVKCTQHAVDMLKTYLNKDDCVLFLNDLPETML